jgi:hypothetical protein
LSPLRGHIPGAKRAAAWRVQRLLFERLPGATPANMTDTAAAPMLPADRPPASAHHHQGSLAKLMLGAIGVVYGDIGTSPIYAFRETFAAHGARPAFVPDAVHIYGVLSLIFWSMMLVVTLKYITIITRADNKGEGGSLALLALINRSTSTETGGSGGAGRRALCCSGCSQPRSSTATA